MKRQNHKTRYMIFLIALAIAFLCAISLSSGIVAFADPSYEPQITIVSQCSNDTYAKEKFASLEFSVSTEEYSDNIISDVTKGGVSLGVISEYDFSVTENTSVTFVVFDNYGKSATKTLTFEKVHNTAVLVSSNLDIGIQYGDGEYTGEESYTIDTTLVDGYYFVNWSYSGTSSGNLINRQNIIDVGEPTTSSESYHYVANYAEINVSSPQNFTYYDGVSRAINYEPQEGFSASITYLYEKDSDDNIINQLVTEPILAGKYTAIIEIVCDSNSSIVGIKEIEIIIARGIIDTITLQSKTLTYDGQEHSLEISGLLPDGSTPEVDYWVNNQRTNAGVTQNIYAVISGGNNYSNYTTSFASITIEPKQIYVTADNKTRQFGHQNPLLTYQVTGLIEGDSLQGNLETFAVPSSVVGDYGLSLGTLHNDNYAINYTSGILTITQGEITLTIDDKQKQYGQLIPNLTYSVTSGIFVTGTTFSGSIYVYDTYVENLVTTFTDVGIYTITAELSNPNYLITIIDGKLTIIGRMVNLIGNITKVYDQNNSVTSSLSINNIIQGEDVYFTTPVYANNRVDAGINLPIAISLAGADAGNYQFNYPQGLAYFTGTIMPREVTIAGNLETYVFDGAEKDYNAYVTGGILAGDTISSLSFTYAGGFAPLFAGVYRAITATPDNSNYMVNVIPEGDHVIITRNNTFSARRVITANGDYRIQLIIRNMTGTDFLTRQNNNIIYSINDSSYFSISNSLLTYALLPNGIVEILFEGRPNMCQDLTDNYYLQIGGATESTNISNSGSSLESAQVNTYNNSGTAISTAQQLKTFLQGSGNGYLTGNIYDFDWGVGGSVLTFSSGRVLEGNGYSVYLTGNYTALEMTQPSASINSWKSWNATGLFIGRNEGILQNIHFIYEGIRDYTNDSYNNANGGRAIGIVSGVNMGTIRNVLLTLAGDFSYGVPPGNPMGYTSLGGLAGLAINNSTIINCTIDFLSGTYRVFSFGNNPKNYTAFGGAVGFMNGNNNTQKENGYYNNASIINSKVSGSNGNIIIEGAFLYAGALIGQSTDGGNTTSAGIVDGVINSFFGTITASNIGTKGRSEKNIGMVAGFVTYIYNVYNTRAYTHVNMPGMRNTENSITMGRGTDYHHVVAFSGTENQPVNWGGFPANLITEGLPVVRMDTTETPNRPMGEGSFDYYFYNLNDGNKPGEMIIEVIPLYNTFVWEVRGIGSPPYIIYNIVDIILGLQQNDNIEDYMIFRWEYYQPLGAQVVLDVAFGKIAYGTVSEVVDGQKHKTYNGRNQREEIIEEIKFEDADGEIIEGFEFIIDAPFIIKDVGEYMVSFGSIVSGGTGGGNDFTYHIDTRSIVYIDFLNEETKAFSVIINPKDAYIYPFVPGEITKVYNGNDYVFYSAQYYLIGFTEVVLEGEYSPLSIKFTYDNYNINTITHGLVYAELVYNGDPNSIIPYNYNLLGVTSFLANITPRPVSINIDIGEFELTYDYFSKEYDGSPLHPDYFTLDNVLAQDSYLGVYGLYFNSVYDVQESKDAGENKIIRFILTNNYYNNYQIIESQIYYDTYISPKYLELEYSNINQSYQQYVTEVIAEVKEGYLIEGDQVLATVDMSGVALSHSSFIIYQDLPVNFNTPNYYITIFPTLTIRYFYEDAMTPGFYLIEKIADLAKIDSNEPGSDYREINYILHNDIDGQNKQFNMISEYSGIFEGNGYVIKNVVLINVSDNSDEFNYAVLALFNTLDESGEIRNLGLVDTSLNNYDNYNLTAGLVAFNYGLIYNCFFEGEIYAGLATSISVVIGGLIGISEGIIEKCYSVVIIKALGENIILGGIVGEINDYGVVDGCIGFIEITAEYTVSAFIGGVVGQSNSEDTLIADIDYLSSASLINGQELLYAVGNSSTQEGNDYSTLRTENENLAYIIDNYRIKPYLVGDEAKGTADAPIRIFNFRQMILLSQFKWAHFELQSDISYHKNFLHKPENGIFSGTFVSAQGYDYVVYLSDDTPYIDRYLFYRIKTGSISVSIIYL